MKRAFHWGSVISAVDGESQWYYGRSKEAYHDSATCGAHRFECLDIQMATVLLVPGVYIMGLTLTDRAAGGADMPPIPDSHAFSYVGTSALVAQITASKPPKILRLGPSSHDSVAGRTDAGSRHGGGPGG